MLIKPFVAASVLNAVATLASRSAPPPQHTHPSAGSGGCPNINFSPKQPFKPFPASTPRTKVCTVSSHKDGVTDDSPYILSAINACNPGGHVVFSKGTKYIIGTALNLTNLSHVDLGKS